MGRNPGHMFNEALKQAFIDDTYKSESGKSTARATFFAIAQFEDEWGTDYCTKSKEDVLANWSVDREFDPEMSDEQRTKELAGWHQAVKATLGWAKES